MSMTARVLSQKPAAAANAVQHGLSGSHYVPEHARDHISALVESIKNTYYTVSPEEEEMVLELAICRWQVYEVDRLIDIKAQNEFKRGPEYFEKHLQAEFGEHLALFNRDPLLGVAALSTTIRGCEFLLGIWSEAKSILAECKPIHPLILHKIVQAMGSPWSLENITSEALAKVAGFIQLMGGDTDLSQLWVKYETLTGFNLKERLKFHLNQAATDPDLKNSLIQFIDSKIREISAIKEILDTQLVNRIEVFSNVYAGYGMLDPAETKHVNTLRRYQTRARNRARELDKILLGRNSGSLEPTRSTRSSKKKKQRSRYDSSLDPDLVHPPGSNTVQDIHDYMDSVDRYERSNKQANDYFEPYPGNISKATRPAAPAVTQNQKPADVRNPPKSTPYQEFITNLQNKIKEGSAKRLQQHQEAMKEAKLKQQKRTIGAVLDHSATKL
ncbi:MAG: hypothetical protein ACKO5E_14195 [bacterium]